MAHEAPRGLREMLRPLKRRMILGIVLSLCAAGIWMLWPLVYGRVIDRVVPSLPGRTGDFAYFTRGVPWLMLLMFLIPLAHYLLWFVIRMIIATLGHRFVMDLRSRLYTHVLSLSMDFFSRNSSGEITQRIMQDAAALQQLFGPQVTQLVVDSVYFTGGVAMMCYLNCKMLLIPAVFVPVYLINYHLFRRRLRRSNIRYRDFADFFVGYTTERLGGAEMVKSFAKEHEEHVAFVGHQHEDAARWFETQRIQYLFSSFCSLITGLGNAAVYLVGCALVLRGRMTLGEVLAYSAYASWIFNPIVRFSQLWGQVEVARVSFDRINSYLRTRPLVEDAPDVESPPPARGEIEFRDVKFSYGGDEPALKDFSLHVPAGNSVALVGHTGCGKSTVIKLLLRWYDPDDGCILVDGRDIRTVRRSWLLRQIGVVLQEPLLFSTTIRENIAYGNPDATPEQIMEAAKQAGLHEFIMQLPDGYDSKLGPDGVKLSTGQKQQLAIARAICADPAILVLDEATASIDSRSEAMIQQALSAAMKNRTSMIVAHRLSTITSVDKIVVMEKGRVVETGSHEDLLAARGRYYELYTKNLAAMRGEGMEEPS